MPELPEVETVKRSLNDYLKGKEIKDVEIRYSPILANIEPTSFQNKIQNQKIEEIKRKGKFLIFCLSDSYLLFHLRMEGKFKYDKALIDKHSHLIFNFKDEAVLIYHDVRKFGRLYYFNKDEDIYRLKPLNKVGYEPFELEDGTYLYDKTRNLKKGIKETLLDQSIIAGIGNIYADEILFASKINPLKKANDLNIKDYNEIISNAKRILNEAIINKGTTIKSFQSSHGVNGNYQDKLLVYGKKDEACPRCKQKLIKIKINGRGTTYCPNCQKE